jgi:Na+-driven multidrug efflux pump
MALPRLDTDTADDNDNITQTDVENPETTLADTRTVLPAGQIVATVLVQSTLMFLVFTTTLSEFGSSMIVTRLNPESADYLAAAGLITTTMNVIVVLPQSLLMPMAMIGSKYEGELHSPEAISNTPLQNAVKKKLADLFKAGLITGTGITLISAAGIFYSKTILTKWFGQDERVAELVQDYLYWYATSLPIYPLRIAGEQLLFALKKPIPAMAIGFPSFLIGTALAITLAFPLKMGIAGAAIGYSVEVGLTGLGCTAYLQYAFRDIPFFTNYSIDDLKKELKNLLSEGLTFLTQFSSEFGAAFAISAFAGKLGKTKQAAYGFLTQLFTLSMLPSFATSNVVTQEVARLIGQKDYINARRFARIGLLTSVGEVMIPNIAIALKPELWTYLMATSIRPSEMAIVKKLMPTAAIQVIVDTAGIGMTNTLRAAGYSFQAMALRIIGIIIGVALAYFLSNLTRLNENGLAGGLTMGLIIGSAILFPLWLDKTSATHIQEQAEKPKSEKPHDEIFFYRVARKCCPTLFASEIATETSSINADARPGYGSDEGTADDQILGITK